MNEKIDIIHTKIQLYKQYMQKTKEICESYFVGQTVKGDFSPFPSEVWDFKEMVFKVDHIEMIQEFPMFFDEDGACYCPLNIVEILSNPPLINKIY